MTYRQLVLSLIKILFMNQIITIGGESKSGKTTTVKLLKPHFPDYECVSIGGIARDLAVQEKWTGSFDLFPGYMRKKYGHKAYDKILDDKLIELGKTKNKLIIDSRLGFHFIPESFKIFLDLPVCVAAHRCLLADGVPKTSKVWDILLRRKEKELKNRRVSDLQTYELEYNINYLDQKNYDLFIDTGHKNNQPSAVARLIATTFKEKVKLQTV